MEYEQSYSRTCKTHWSSYFAVDTESENLIPPTSWGPGEMSSRKSAEKSQILK